MRLLPKSDSKPLGLIWVDGPPPAVITGLVRALGEQARVHFGTGPPGAVPSSVILYASGQEDLSENIERHREVSLDKPPILVFGPHLDLALARDALRAGASGFVH